MIRVTLNGFSALDKKLDRLITDEDMREDLGTFKKRGERRGRKRAGVRNNRVTGQIEGDRRLRLESTLINPRQSGKAWQNEFQRAIYPAMAKRVFRARARKIEERFKA